MPIKKTLDNNTMALELPDTFNFQVSRALRELYQGEPAGRRVVIDLRRVKHMDSSALGTLLLVRDHFGADISRLHVIHATKEVRKILQTARFDRYFTIV